ncbi:MAG: hypothetical protein J0H09_10505, partial [Burkholderiales bacterium]|nr:hypothetical protein [Burkholderiales bacterium]
MLDSGTTISPTISASPGLSASQRVSRGELEAVAAGRACDDEAVALDMASAIEGEHAVGQLEVDGL